jgi:hypothetical protein
MEEDLRLRNYRERTVEEYLKCAGKFAEFSGRSPYRSRILPDCSLLVFSGHAWDSIPASMIFPAVPGSP